MTLDELEALASAATPGQWRYDCGNGQVETCEHRIIICNRHGNYDRCLDVDHMYGDSDVGREALRLASSFDNEDDLLFIAAANPATVLNLIARVRLAELEKGKGPAP